MLSPGEIDALHKAAHFAWDDDTRLAAYYAHPEPSAGQCYVTARWLADRLGGNVGRKNGHYFFVSSDGSYALDLTSCVSPGPVVKQATDSLYSGAEIIAAVPEPRATRFAARANAIFDDPDRLLKIADLLGDAYPAQEPQAVEDANQRLMHDDPGQQPGSGEYQFVYANGQLEVSPFHDHDSLAQHAGVSDDHTGPMALGYVTLNTGQALWHAGGNISPRALQRVFKDYGKHVGWSWGGLTNLDGEPINDDFAPARKTTRVYFAFIEDDFRMAFFRGGVLDPETRISGYVEHDGETGRVHVTKAPTYYASLRHIAKRDEAQVFEPLNEWAADNGITLLSTENNVLHRIEDLDQENLYDPNPTEPPAEYPSTIPDERAKGGVYRCQHCDVIFPTWDAYVTHRLQQEGMGEGEPLEDGGFPEADPGVYGDGAHFTEMRQEPGIHTGNADDFMKRLDDLPLRRLNPIPNLSQSYKVGDRVVRQYNSVINAPDPSHEDHIVHGLNSNGGEIVGGPFDPGFHHPDFDHYGSDTTFAEPSYVVRWDVGSDHTYKLHPGGQTGWTRQSELWPVGHPALDKAVEEPMTLPEHWGVTMVAPVSDARRAGYQGPEEGTFLVAYRHGTPVGYARLADGKLAALEGPRLPLVAKAQRVAEKEHKDLLDGPLPFIYDVQDDTIHLGHPGTRVSDIEGRFTPGGIVEGIYEPGGKVIIKTMTNMPYTVRHLLTLWYNVNPTLEVRSVHLRDEAGGDTKLAAHNVGGYIASLVAADPTVHTAARALQAHGGQVYVVGGAVRDAILGKEPHDLDLMVRGLPGQDVNHILRSLRGQVKLTGSDFGVFRYREGNSEVEIALPRRERSIGEGHRDFDVQTDHTMKPEEDLYRRDFTANAMAVDLSTGQLVDPFGGANDIGSGTLRTIGEHTFREDPLRVVRALVAHAKHGLVPDAATRDQMQRYAAGLKHLPAERVQAELDKLMAAADPASAIRLAHDTGTLGHFLPEVEDTFGYDQKNPHHAHDLGTHLLEVLGGMQQLTDDPDMRMAALLHDIGKPASAWWHPEHGKQKFYQFKADRDIVGPDGRAISKGQIVGQDHWAVGADMARDRLRALKYPTDRISRIGSIIDGHMFPNFDTPKAARKFLNKYGEHADDLLTFRQADRGGKGVSQGHLTPVDTQKELVDRVRNAGEPTSTAQLALNGRDLIAAGFTPGPQMGEILRHLTERVIEDPALNDRDTLLNLAQNYGTI